MTEPWVNEYMNRGQKAIITSLEEDKHTPEQIKELKAYEKNNDNRKMVMDFLKKIIKGNKEPKKTDAVINKNGGKNREKKEGQQYVKIAKEFEAMKGGILLRPTNGAPVDIYWNRWTPVSQETLDYLKEKWEDWQYEVIDEEEYEERLEAQHKEIKKNKGAN